MFTVECTVYFFCVFVCSVISVHVVFAHRQIKGALKNMQKIMDQRDKKDFHTETA